MFKGDKIVCVDKIQTYPFRIGKVYEIKELPTQGIGKGAFGMYIFVTDDNGGTYLYPKSWFISIQEDRKRKIRSLI